MVRCGDRRLQLSVRPRRTPEAVLRCFRRLVVPDRRGTQPSGPCQSHVLRTLFQKQSDRGKTRPRQRKKLPPDRADPRRPGVSGYPESLRASGTAPRPDRRTGNRHRSDHSSAVFAGPCAGTARAAVCTGRHRVFAGASVCPAQPAAGGAGSLAGLAGSEPGRGCSRAAVGALFCSAGHPPLFRTVRQPFCHPADCPRQ